jgi:zinc transport system substrate-binding protein
MKPDPHRDSRPKGAQRRKPRAAGRPSSCPGCIGVGSAGSAGRRSLSHASCRIRRWLRDGRTTARGLRPWAPFVAPLSVLCALVLAACNNAAEPTATTPPPPRHTIYTTFYPTTYFARRIAPEAFEVICPVPEDVDPIFWQPPREAIAAYQRAGAIILNGAAFEKWAITAALPRSRVVNAAADIPGGFITFKATSHSHGAGGEHTHEGIDGHTWLDPHAAIAQAEAIRDGLARLFPDHTDDFARGAGGLRRDLEALDTRFSELTEQLEGIQLLASHPAYNYLARRYTWAIINFDLDPESPISDEAWTELSAEADPDARARILLWESEPLPETADRLSRELNIVSIVFSPCESLDRDEQAAGADYLSLMRVNADRLETAASPSGG